MRNRAKRGIVLERCYVWLTFKHRILLREKEVRTNVKYSLQGTTQGRYLTGGVPPVRFSM